MDYINSFLNTQKKLWILGVYPTQSCKIIVFMLLDSIRSYFVKDFYLYVQGIGLSFSLTFLPDLDISVTVA